MSDITINNPIIVKGEKGTSIESAELVDNNLKITLTDGEIHTIYGVKGDKGDVGNGINDANVDVDGNLEITLIDGTVLNSGLVKGSKGDTGPKGDAGVKGDTGPQGDQGPKGDTGPKGDVGPKGDTGVKGDQGLKGPQGDKGATGPSGDNGDQGAQGPKGDVGPKGDTGPKGDVGPQGPKGDEGPPGEVTGVYDVSINDDNSFTVSLTNNEEINTSALNVGSGSQTGDVLFTFRKIIETNSDGYLPSNNAAESSGITFDEVEYKDHVGQIINFPSFDIVFDFLGESTADIESVFLRNEEGEIQIDFTNGLYIANHISTNGDYSSFEINITDDSEDLYLKFTINHMFAYEYEFIHLSYSIFTEVVGDESEYVAMVDRERELDKTGKEDLYNIMPQIDENTFRVPPKINAPFYSFIKV